MLSEGFIAFYEEFCHALLKYFNMRGMVTCVLKSLKKKHSI